MFNFVVCNPCQSSPSLTILVPLWFIIISLVFSSLSKVLFSGFLHFKGNSFEGQSISNYHDVSSLSHGTSLSRLEASTFWVTRFAIMAIFSVLFPFQVFFCCHTYPRVVMDANAHHIASQLPCKMLRGKWRSLEAVSCGNKSRLMSIQVKTVISWLF